MDESTAQDRRTFAKMMRVWGNNLDEIGEALGVTRERARQLVVGGTGRRGTSRIDGISPVDPIRAIQAYRKHGTYRGVARELGVQNQSEIKMVLTTLGAPPPRSIARAKAKFRMFSIGREVARRLGRTPVAREIGEALGFGTLNSQQAGTVGQAIRYFGSYEEYIRLIGCEPRGRGSDAHLDPSKRKKRDWCKRGHFLTETRDQQGKCKACNNLRRKRYEQRKKEEASRLASRGAERGTTASHQSGHQPERLANHPQREEHTRRRAQSRDS